MNKFLLLILFTVLLLASCCRKKSDNTESLEIEESALTQEQFLADKLKEYLETNPLFPGFYVKDKELITGICLDGEKLYEIEYKLEGGNFVEDNRSELTMGSHSNKWVPGYNRDNGHWYPLKLEKYKSFVTLEYAVLSVTRCNYGTDDKIKSVTATSVLGEKYAVENLIDGSWKSWAEGEEGSGIGTKITFEYWHPYHFKNATNYACIDIVNGYGDLKYFYQNNRVKEMNLWIEKILLYDRHVGQLIVLGKYLGDSYVRKLTLEILSVYPGSKYDDTCIAEIH